MRLMFLLKAAAIRPSVILRRQVISHHLREEPAQCSRCSSRKWKRVGYSGWLSLILGKPCLLLD